MTNINDKWIGQSPKRKEDIRLLTGRGRYTGDLQLPGMLHAAVLRSPYAHALIKSVDVSKALEYPGVVHVITGEDLRGILDVIPALADLPERNADHPCLAQGKVRYVGEPVAIVVATNRYVAEDALEQIEVDYEPLRPICNYTEAMESGERLFDNWPDNIAWEWELQGGDVSTAFKEADLVVSDTFTGHRHTGVTMETRAVVAKYEWTTGELTVWTSSQGPYRVRNLIAPLLNVPATKVRVLSSDVGGGFGIKFHIYPEEILIPYLAKQLKRPIKWVEDRREHFMSTIHGRGMTFDAEMAFTKDGTILGVRSKLFYDMGAYNLTESHAPAWLGTASIPGPYRIANCSSSGIAFVSNKVPFGAYRGFGSNEGHWARERLIDIAARKLGLDPVEIRLKNLLQPNEFPYNSSVGLTYDSGQYPANMRVAMETLGYQEWRTEQERARASGRYIGIGVACYNESSLWANSRLLAALGVKDGGYVGARVTIEQDGNVTVSTAMSIQGQGIETMLAQVCADVLEVHPDSITVLHDDTAMCPPSGYQSGGSRGAGLGGGSVAVAAGKVKDKMLKIAAHKLETDIDSIDYKNGKFYVRISPEQSVTLQTTVTMAYLANELPEGMEPGLEATYIFDPENFAFANGTTMVVVEVDPQTFQTKFLKFVIAHDCGVMINPANVEGQIIGGAVQGIGGVMSEELIYDENGQLLTTTLTDYRVPRAGDVPSFELCHTVTPTPINVLGAKGVGEGGTLGPYPAISAAIEDALAPLGFKVNRLPLTPPRIFDQINQA